MKPRNLFLFRISLFLVWVGGSALAGDQKPITLNVLFLGNSLTAFNDLPAMVAGIAGSQGHKLVYEVIAPGGARLIQHAADPDVLNKLREHSWDFVVLQEQSQLPALSQEQKSKRLFPAVKHLKSVINALHPEANLVFYMTMARRYGDPQNQHISADLATYEGMQDRVNQCYVALAKDNQSMVAPVGEAWRAVRRQRPHLNLYSDAIHPNKKGTYLAACVFYATLFQSPSAGASVLSPIKKTKAAYLQNVADHIVLGENRVWDWRP